ncbi:PIR Superfamily Protein [Plasmodium ovale wallikeri]|uniref:PIR Superfamily Protein n=1 Tax=Plasmodium ovale wallikeri TaxID=864142 RepID=A0A1A9AB22_PLAOA|nr:PIR Superfamily Protein [Plasmodium ovale wallikeri]SBT56985.1 PIR Superfamily Protein [Plasmodium ovale wallikeri]
MENNVTELFDSRSHEIYKQFTLDESKNVCEPYCENYIKEYGWSGSEIHKICCNLYHYLEKIIKSEKNTKNKDIYCRHLIYWIHDKIIDNKIHEKELRYVTLFVYIHKAWLQIKEKLNFPKGKMCTLKIESQINRTKLKKLFYYYQFYDTMRNNISKDKESCEKYYKYLKDMAALYDEYSGYCVVPRNFKCPDIFKKVKTRDPRDLLDFDQCKLLLEEENKAAPEKMEEPVYVHEDSEDDNTGKSLFYSLTGAAYTALMLYKFTPIGSMLGSKFLSKPNIVGDIDEPSNISMLPEI